MRGYSPPYYSPPRRGYGDRGRSPPYGGRGRSPPYGGRGRSPPRRGYGGYGRRKEQNHGSLLVRNIPLDCRPEELRVPFERFGVVRDVYIPKDYYTGEPRGFAFVQFVDSYDATEAQYHMNGQVFAGREISVVVAAETRKRPEDMRQKARIRGPSGYGRRRSSYYGRSRSRSASHSRSPHYPSSSRVRYRSRSYSPAPRRRSEYSLSPNERRLYNSRSPIDRNEDDIRVYSPDDGYDQKASFRSDGGARAGWRSPPAVRATRSLSGSRSRSPDMRPRHGGR